MDYFKMMNLEDKSAEFRVQIRRFLGREGSYSLATG